MKKLFALILLMFTVAAPSYAALDVGDAAPNFTASAALGGKVFKFTLADSLAKGPVVLYFFPAAFSVGCSAEAHEFAEATDDFRKSGASVIGLSADPVDKLARFSTEDCRSKFPVATATAGTIAAYDVRLPQKEGLSNRTSYVIAPSGKILYAHSDLDYRDHVKNTLAAVRTWKASQPKK